MPVIRYDFYISSGIQYSDVDTIDISESEISYNRFTDLVDDCTEDSTVCKNGWDDINSIYKYTEDNYIETFGMYSDETGSIDMYGGYDVLKYPESGKIVVSDTDMLPVVDGHDTEKFVLVPFVYKNVDNKKYVHKRFSLYDGTNEKWSYDGNPNTLTNNMFSTDGHDISENNYIEIKLSNPIEYSNISEYKSSITMSEYDDIKSGAKVLLEKEIIDMSEKINVKGQSIRLKYFPVYESVSLFYMDNGTKKIDVSKYSVIQSSGVVTIDKDFVGKTIYAVYGIIPAIRVLTGNRIDLSEVSKYKDITLMSIRQKTFNDNFSKTIISDKINMDTGEESSVVVHVPQEYDRFFIESDSPISVNGQNIKGGGMIFLPNDYENSLSIGQTSDIVDMISPVAKTQDGKYSLKGFLPSDMVSIYADFMYSDGVERLTHVAMNKKNTDGNLVKYGYGVGGYGENSYGGYILDGDKVFTKILGNDTEPDTVEIENRRITFGFDSSKSGKNIVMPAIPDISTIEIIKTKKGLQPEVFKNFTVVSPDILVVSDDEEAEYMVSFAPIINPVLTTIRTTNGVFTSSTLKNIELISGFKGLYAIYSKTINIRFGYISEYGAIKYFNNSDIQLSANISRDTVLGITSNFKNIILGQ